MGSKLLRNLFGCGLVLIALVACSLAQSESPISTPASELSVIATPGSPLSSQEQGPSVFSRTWLGVPVVLLLLAAGGGVLFLVTGSLVYILIRRRRQPEAVMTTQAPTATPPVRAAERLPVGTQLAEGRYVVLGAYSEADAGGAYEVKATTPTHVCPQCYRAVRETQAESCPSCGIVLPTTLPEHPVLVAREIDAERFATVSELLARRLAHAALVVPVAAFIETSLGGLARYFQVEPKVEGRLASSFEPPQPLTAVAAWGEMLARGLAYLHGNLVMLDTVAPERILVDGEQARWICFDGVRALSEEPAGDADAHFLADVAGLARFLYERATGVTDPQAMAQLPPLLGDIFSRALTSSPEAEAVPRAREFADALEDARWELARREPTRYLVGAKSDVGRSRKLNEDSLFVQDCSDAFAPQGLAVGMFAVADGVGGHAAGDVASQLAVGALSEVGDDLRRSATGRGVPNAADWAVEVAEAANRAVYEERQAASSDMGCTLVGALMVGRAATLLNVGDSRAYLMGARGIRQVTVDHSLVQRLVEIGQLTRAEARRHPQKSIIYRVVGDTPNLAYDLFDVVLEPGAALLLCSDGLSDMVEDEVLWQVWRETNSPQAACDHLVSLANEAGGYDNITVVIVQVGDA